MICVTYLDYIFPFLVCVNCPLTLNMGGWWNMLESSSYRIPLIGLSHKWTWITFYCFEFQTSNLDLQTSCNLSKPTIQILWFSNSITYKNYYWTSSTLKSSQFTKYLIRTHYTSISLRTPIIETLSGYGINQWPVSVLIALISDGHRVVSENLVWRREEKWSPELIIPELDTGGIFRSEVNCGIP